MESDTQELQIDTIEGLQAFWGYVNDVYSELQSYALSENEEEQVDHIYDALKKLIEDSLDRKERGGHVSEEDSNRIQTGYDELFEILEQFESSKVLTPPTTETLPSRELSAESTEQVNHIQTPHILSTENPATASPIPAMKPLSLQETQTSHSVASQDVLSKEATRIAYRADNLLKTYKNIADTITSSEVKAVAEQYVSQLLISTKRAHSTKQQLIEKLKQGNPILSDLVKEHYEDILKEIDENLDQLATGLSTFLAPKDRTPSLETPPATQKKSRATLGIAHETTEEGTLPILIAPPTQKKLISPREKSVTNVIHNATQKPATTRIERLIQSPLTSHIETVLSIPRYHSFVAAKIGSPIQAEAMIRREVHHIEAPSKFEAIFGFTYASAFYTFLLNMTAREISEFDSQPRHAIRAILNEKNIKYEIYLDWIDLLVPILELTRAHADVPFAELFIRAQFELMLREASATT